MSDLEDKYEKLLQEYNKLKNEYSENTIVQSMNDMKSMYDIQKKKIDKLNDIIYKITNMNKSIKLMLSVVCKNASNYTFTSRYELKHRLEFIQEILDICLKSKNEMYYLEYNE
jgi:predicted nuclease with TOPRIM domain